MTFLEVMASNPCACLSNRIAARRQQALPAAKVMSSRLGFKLSATFALVKKIGVVVPTLGTRSDYLRDCLKSLSSHEEIVVCVVAPEEVLSSLNLSEDILKQADLGEGVAAAINAGFKKLEDETSPDWMTWIGDDDILAEGAVAALTPLTRKPGVVAVVGRCIYLDGSDKEIFVSRPNRISVGLLEFGPNRIPQPGSFYLSTALREVGYLDETLRFAFDQDLFHKLKRVGEIKATRKLVSWYRWHPGSLSYSGTALSVLESHNLRMKYCPKHLAFIPWVWHNLHKLVSRVVPPRLGRRS